MEEHRIKKALLVIDLQQDFISPNGPFKQSHAKADHIISNLSVVLPHFRDQNGIVIWIKSDYSKPELEPKYLIRPEGEQFKNIPLNNDFHSGTHKTFPLCVPGTDGAKFIPEIQTLLDEEQDLVICKKFYSAFTNTTLADILKNVNEVHICGLTTNVCVQATTTDAFFHGYKIFVWTDCLGYRREKIHRKALSYMKQWYATMINSSECLTQAHITTSKPVLDFVDGSMASRTVMMAIYEKDIAFEETHLKVMSTESLTVPHHLEGYCTNTLPLLPIEQAKHINGLQRIEESQNLWLRTLQMIGQKLTLWKIYLIKMTFITCDEFTLADYAFYSVIAYLIYRGLDIEKSPLLRNYIDKINRTEKVTF